MPSRMPLMTLLLLGAQAVIAKDLYVYPAGGQSAEQLDKDKYECHSWAVNDSGVDPTAPQQTTQAPQGNKKSGGVAKGALAGAATGAIIGDRSKYARRGAVAGGLIGGVSQSAHNQQVDATQQQHAQQEAARQADRRDNYNRAYAACLEGRGYTVK